MELNVSVLSDFVRNAEVLWVEGFMSVPQAARNSGLFRVMPIAHNTGNTREFSEIELEQYAAEVNESEQFARAKVQQGYTKIGRLVRRGKDIGISHVMRTQGKYMEIQAALKNLGSLVPNRLDLDLTHRITFGASTTYTDMDGNTVDLTVGDGYQLFYTAHTVRGSSTTFRNILANNPQFSYGAFEAMKKMRVQNSINQFGEKVAPDDDIIFSTEDPVTVHTIAEVLRSTSNPTQSNPSVVNAQAGAYKHVVLPRLATTASGANDTTKEKYWGVASSRRSSAYLGMHEEASMKAPAGSGSNAEEFSTQDWQFGTFATYMICVVGAAWIALSKGDASA